MASLYLIGIDGGGSGTRARLVTPDGRVLGQGEAGPSGLSQGIAQAWRHVGEAIGAAFANAGLVPAAPAQCALGLGLAGVVLPERRAQFLREAPAYAAIALDTDGYAALLGAHAGRPGVLVVAGTGSIGEAVDAQGRRRAAGGWGFPVGDEGSGAWLGLRAARVAQRVADGRHEGGALAAAVWRHVGGREQLLAWGAQAGQRAYAALAPLVFETEASDPVAAALLREAVAELEALVHALDPAGTLPLALAGSIARRLEPRFAPALRARLAVPRGDALDGALHLVRRALAGAGAAGSAP